MADAQANSTQQESDIIDNNTDVLESEDDLLGCNLKFPMDDSDILRYSQDFDDSDDLLEQNEEEDMSQNAAENVGNSQNAADDLESSQNSAEDVQNSQNVGDDIVATQCNEGDEILRTQRSQRFEPRKKNAQLNRDKVKDAHS